MKVTKTGNQTVQTLVLAIEDGPVIRSDDDAHRVRSRSYRVRDVTIEVVNGQFNRVAISGPIALAAGGFSLTQRSGRWFDRHDLDHKAPPWVREMVYAALDNRTAWTQELDGAVSAA